jgi:hypothetical protein
MADVKISQLPAATTPLTGAEQVPLVQGGVTKRTTVLDLSASQTLQTVTSNGATTTINSAFNGANIGTFSGIPAVTSTGATVGLANATNAAVLVDSAWRGTSNNNVSLGALGYNWNNVYGTTFNVGSGTATMTASGNNLVLNAVAAAVAGVGFAPATDNLYFLGGSSLKWKALYLGDGALTWNSYAIPAPTGGVTTFLRNDGTWAVPGGGGGGSGTVTSVSVITANGFTGTVATATTTPAITLTTSVTGLLKGNGTAISAATAGTDYVVPGGALGTPSSGTLTNATGLPLTTGVTGLLPVANGGTGTATPGLVQGTNVTITGTWPNQTINATGGGGGMTYPGAGIANSTGSAWGTSYSTTGSGTVLALATSPTLVTPALGTPASGDFSTGTFTWPTFNQNTTGTAANITASSNSTITTLSALSLPGSQVSGNISGSAANVTGTVAIGNGGTGATTAAAALTALGAYPATNPSGFTSNTGTVTSVGWTGGIVTVATGTTTPAFTIAGTSGGVPYFNSASTWATSAALTASTLLVGGGAGAAPTTTTTATGALTFLGTPSSANLASMITDETGSGLLVFGTTPTLTNPTITNYVETPYTATISAGAITLDLTNGTVQFITFGAANATITMPTAVSGKSFTLFLKQDSVGSRAATWTTVSWPSATAPTLTTTANKLDKFVFTSNGTSWFGSTAGQNYT